MKVAVELVKPELVKPRRKCRAQLPVQLPVKDKEGKVVKDDKGKVTTYAGYVECGGTITRRIYQDSWFVEDCDSCSYVKTGFDRRV